MKKRYLAFLVIVSAFWFIVSAPPSSEKGFTSKSVYIEASVPEQTHIQEESQLSFILPASLQIIDDEAFEGTGIRSVHLSESVTRIGDRSFANNENLLSVRLPAYLEQIGNDVIDGSEKAVMDVYANSDALNRIREKGYRFRVMTAFAEKRRQKQFGILSGTISHIRESERQHDSCPAEKSKERAGRTITDL